MKSSTDAPNCTNCHGNHQIVQKEEKGNLISNPKGLVQLCSSCHNSVELAEKYAIPVRRTESFKESFHGLAIRGGSKTAANCESCHGHHNIRPSDDTLSTIYKVNLPNTCGKCHPGAVEAFFMTPIHITTSEEDSPWVYWITRIYLFLIFAIIGGMILHNALDFMKKFKAKKKS
jgi:nitrate/TMAO reductase-like tetraheme cytochrome c subunit